MAIKKEDLYPFIRHVENRRIEMGVTETAIDKGIDRGKKQRSIEVAKEALKNKLDFALISTLTQLSIEEVEKLSKGENVEVADE